MTSLNVAVSRGDQALTDKSTCAGLSSPISWRLQRTVTCLLTLLPSLFFYVAISQWFLRVPFVDDFDAILNFLLGAQAAESMVDKLTLVFAQHNEHRIALLRGASLFQVTVLGHVDLVALSWLSAGLMVSFYCFVICFQLLRARENDSSQWLPLAALPLGLLLFQPLGFEGFLWPTVSLGSSAVLLCGWGIVLLLAEPTWRRLGAALLLLAISIFSLGNGLALFPAVFIGLLLYGKARWALVWALGGGLVSALYFIGFYAPPGHPSMLESLGHISRNVAYTLYFIGSGISFGHSGIALGVGIGVAIWMAYLTLFRARVVTFQHFTFLVFLLGSVASNALARSEFGVTYALTQNRYQFISCLILGMVLLTVVERLILRFQTKGLVSSLTLVSLLLWFHLYCYRVALPQLQAKSQQAAHGFRAWLSTGQGLVYPWPDRSNDIMLRAIKSGIFPLGARERKRLNRRLSSTLSDEAKGG